MSSDRARVTGEDFRRACGRFATGVTIATVLDAAGAPHGLTVSSFTAVSLDPPMILICLGHDANNIEYFRGATHFGINILGESQVHLSERFARKGHDRFEGLEWRRGVTGVPLLPDTVAQIECEIHSRIPMGDHDIFAAVMVNMQVNGGTPLLHFAGAYRKLETE